MDAHVYGLLICCLCCTKYTKLTQLTHKLGSFPMNLGQTLEADSCLTDPLPNRGQQKKSLHRGKTIDTPPHIIWSAPKAYTATCDQGDVIGSTWILNFQPMSRCYIMRRSQMMSVRLHYAHSPGGNRFRRSCKQGITCWLRPCVGRCWTRAVSVYGVGGTRLACCVACYDVIVAEWCWAGSVCTGLANKVTSLVNW